MSQGKTHQRLFRATLDSLGGYEHCYQVIAVVLLRLDLCAGHFVVEERLLHHLFQLLYPNWFFRKHQVQVLSPKHI